MKQQFIIGINAACMLQMQSETSPAPLPQIVLTECNSLPTSPSEDSAEAQPSAEQQAVKEHNSGSDITVSYFSHIVKTPSLLPWKQVPASRDLDSARMRQAPVGDVTRSWPPLTSERAIKQPLKREPRVQDSLEAERETRDEQMRDQRPVVLHASETSRVGGEKEDICHSTYRRLDSLEETIRELELSLMEFSTDPNTGDVVPTAVQTQGSSDVNGANQTHRVAEMPGEGGESNRPPVPPKPSHVRTSTVKVQSSRQSLFSCFHLKLFLFSVEGLWFLPLGVSTRKSVFAHALMNCLPPVSCCLKNLLLYLSHAINSLVYFSFFLDCSFFF